MGITIGTGNYRPKGVTRLKPDGNGSGITQYNGITGVSGGAGDSPFVFLAESNSRMPTTTGPLTGGTTKAIIYRPLKICGAPSRIRVVCKTQAYYGISSQANIGNDLIIDEMMITCPAGRKTIWTNQTVADGDMTVTSPWVTAAELGLPDNIEEADGVVLKGILAPQDTLNIGTSAVDHTDNYGGVAFAQMHRYNPAVTTITNRTGHGIYTWTGTNPNLMAFMACFEIQGEYISDTGHVSIVVIGTSQPFGANDGTYVYPTWTTPFRSIYGTGYACRGAADDAGSNAGRHWGIANHARSSSQTSLHLGATAWLESCKKAKYLQIDHATNDLASGVSVATFKSNFTSLVALAKAVNPNIKIVAVECIPRVTTSALGTPVAVDYTLVDESLLYPVSVSNFNAANVKDVNAWYWTEKAAGNIDSVVSIGAIRGAANDEVLRTGMTEDGVHLSDEGHKRMAASMRLTYMELEGKLRHWYDPFDTYNMTIAGGLATTIKDKAGTNDIIDLSGYTDPAYDTTYTGASSDRNAWVFGGADQMKYTTPPVVTDGIDIILNIRPQGAGTNRWIFGDSSDSDDPRLYLNSSNLITLQKGASNLAFGSALTAGTDYTLDAYTTGGGAGTGFKVDANGANVLTYASTPAFGNGNTVGFGGRNGSSPFNGGIGEMVWLVPNDVAAADRTSIRASMVARAGL